MEFLVAAESREEATKAAEEIAESMDSIDWETDDHVDCWPREVDILDAKLVDEIKLYGIWVGGPEGKFRFDTKVPEPDPPDPRLPGPGQGNLLDTITEHQPPRIDSTPSL